MEIKEEEKEKVINNWLDARSIKRDDFDKKTDEILAENHFNRKLLDQYVENEVLSYRWATKQWEKQVPQIYLECKETYDTAKIRILFMDRKEKGLALEIYQILNEEEEEFDEIGNKFGKVKYSTKRDGSWVRKIDMKSEIRMRVEKLKMEEVSKPFIVEDKYVIVQLMGSKGTSLNSDITHNIISKKLNKFIDYGVIELTEYCLLDGHQRSNDNIKRDEDGH